MVAVTIAITIVDVSGMEVTAVAVVVTNINFPTAKNASAKTLKSKWHQPRIQIVPANAELQTLLAMETVMITTTTVDASGMVETAVVMMEANGSIHTASNASAKTRSSQRLLPQSKAQLHLSARASAYCQAF